MYVILFYRKLATTEELEVNKIKAQPVFKAKAVNPRVMQ